MLSRFRSLLVVATLVSAASVGSLATPGTAAACSCMPVQPISNYAGEPTTVIMSGTVQNIGPDQTGTFQVERWYQGEAPSGRIIPIRGGNGADCGLFMQAGQQLLVVAYRGEDGVLQPSLCAPSGDLSTPEGRQLLADTEASFGSGIAIAGGSETPGPETAPGGIDLATVLIIGFVVLVGLVLALGALAVVRRDRGAPAD